MKKKGVNKYAPDRNVLQTLQGYWHSGNTLDAYVTYLVQAGQKDAAGIIASSLVLFHTPPDPPPQGGKQHDIWWRDDYGWWELRS